MQKRKVLFAGLGIALLAAAWGYYQYQKPREGLAGVAADYNLTAEALYAEYSNNEPAADKKYSGRVLAVTGRVKDVQPAAQGLNVLLEGGATGGVNCSFQNKAAFESAAGNTVVIKGRCAGFLMDVSLVDAVELKK